MSDQRGQLCSDIFARVVGGEVRIALKGMSNAITKKKRFGECYKPVLRVKPGVVRILVICQDRPIFGPTVQ